MRQPERRRQQQRHRRDEGGVGADHRQRDHRLVEEVDRQDGAGHAALATDVEGADHHPDQHDEGRDDRAVAMHRRLGAADDEPEHRRALDRADDVELAVPRHRVGQGAPQQQRGDGEGDGAGEHPRPWRDAQDQAAERWRRCRRAGDDHRVDAEPATKLPGRISLADQRRGDPQRPRRADRLAGAHHQQERQALGEEAQQGRDGEDRLAQLVHALQPDPLAQPGEGQHQHDQHQLIDCNDRHHRARPDMEIARDRRQRDGGDAAVDDDQRRAEAQRRDRRIAAGQRQAVGARLQGWRRSGHRRLSPGGVDGCVRAIPMGGGYAVAVPREQARATV